MIFEKTATHPASRDQSQEARSTITNKMAFPGQDRMLTDHGICEGGRRRTALFGQREIAGNKGRFGLFVVPRQKKGEKQWNVRR